MEFTGALFIILANKNMDKSNYSIGHKTGRAFGISALKKHSSSGLN